MMPSIRHFMNRRIFPRFRSMSSCNQCGPCNTEAEKNRDYLIFKPRFLKKHPDVWPILAIIGFICTALPIYIAYYLPRRNDLNFSKDRERAPEEFYDVMHPKKQKNVTFNQVYEPLPDLNAALEFRKDYWKMRRDEERAKAKS